MSKKYNPKTGKFEDPMDAVATIGCWIILAPLSFAFMALCISWIANHIMSLVGIEYHLSFWLTFWALILLAFIRAALR